MFNIREFTRAIEIVNQVMKDGAAKHPSDDWNSHPFEFRIGRAIPHLRLWEAVADKDDRLGAGDVIAPHQFEGFRH